MLNYRKAANHLAKQCKEKIENCMKKYLKTRVKLCADSRRKIVELDAKLQREKIAESQDFKSTSMPIKKILNNLPLRETMEVLGQITDSKQSNFRLIESQIEGDHEWDPSGESKPKPAHGPYDILEFLADKPTKNKFKSKYRATTAAQKSPEWFSKFELGDFLVSSVKRYFNKAVTEDDLSERQRGLGTLKTDREDLEGTAFFQTSVNVTSPRSYVVNHRDLPSLQSLDAVSLTQRSTGSRVEGRPPQLTSASRGTPRYSNPILEEIKKANKQSEDQLTKNLSTLSTAGNTIPAGEVKYATEAKLLAEGLVSPRPKADLMKVLPAEYLGLATPNSPPERSSFV